MIRSSFLRVCFCVCVLTYEGSDATSADGGLEVTLQLLLDGAGGVKALSQQDDGVDKEERRDAVDDVLKDLDPEHTHTQMHKRKDNVKNPTSCSRAVTAVFFSQTEPQWVLTPR